MTNYEEAWKQLRQWLSDSVEVLGESNHGTPVRRGVLSRMDLLESQDLEPAYYTLQASDVGKATIKAFGRTWHTSNFIGRVLPGDVGKRVFKQSTGFNAFLQVENDQQRDERRTTELMTEANKAGLSLAEYLESKRPQVTAYLEGHGPVYEENQR